MLTGIDHLVIATVDPDDAAVRLEAALGLRVGGGGRHAALGTFNRLVWLGDTYLELIGVLDPGLAAASWIGAPTLRALEAGGGLATWAVASDAIEDDVTLLRARGSDMADPIPGERTRPDGRLVRWRLAAPRRLGPAEPPFLIEHDPTAAEWTPAERAARAAERHPIGGPVRLEVLEIALPDMTRAATRFQSGAGLGPFRPSLAGGGARDAAIGAQTLRLRPRRAAVRVGPGRSAAPGAMSPGAVPVPAGTSPPTIVLRVAGVAPAAALGAELLGCRWVVRRG